MRNIVFLCQVPVKQSNGDRIWAAVRAAFATVEIIQQCFFFVFVSFWGEGGVNAPKPTYNYERHCSGGLQKF